MIGEVVRKLESSWCIDPSTSKSTGEYRDTVSSSPAGCHSEKEANDAKDLVGRIVREESEDTDRNFSASSPKATRNSGLHISKAVNLERT